MAWQERQKREWGVGKATDKEEALMRLPTAKRSPHAFFRVFKSQRGVALLMTLVLTAILLVIMATMIQMIISGTQLSGIEKRYKTALEAGAGGATVIYQLIGARQDPGIPLTNFLITAPGTCLTDKLTKATANWNSACSQSLTIDPTSSTSYDMKFDLGAVANPNYYRVYGKIVDTVQGNSGTDSGLSKNQLTKNTSEITIVSVPYLYTVEIDAENATNPNERAKLSVLYQY